MARPRASGAAATNAEIVFLRPHPFRLQERYILAVIAAANSAARPTRRHVPSGGVAGENATNGETAGGGSAAKYHPMLITKFM